MVGLDWSALSARLAAVDPDGALDAARLTDLCEAIEAGALEGMAEVRARMGEGGE